MTLQSHAPMRIALPLLLLSGCATLFASPPPPAPAPAAKKAPTEAELLVPKVEALAGHAAAVTAARDDAVWAFWLGGSPNALETVWKGHEPLLEDAALVTLRRARTLEAYDPATLDAVEALIVGELVGRLTRDAESAVDNLEASVRFNFEAREVLFSEMSSMLSAERAPNRRLTLWLASLPAAERVASAMAKRDDDMGVALSAVQLTPDAFAQLLRHVDLDAVGQWADRFLTTTDGRWKQRLSDLKVLTRADLPFALKASPALDAAFPKARIAERGTQLLASLGLYGQSGLTLSLEDSPRKQPLPLTVSGVRLSFKPRGGWRDQQLLLAELGRALATRFASPAKLPADRRVTETTAALFAALATDRTWLEEQQIAPPLIAAAAELGNDQRLLLLRRGAGALLASLRAPDAQKTWLDRAYGLPDDAVRARLELDPLFSSADMLRAHAAAEALRRHLEVQGGPKWWASPKAGAVLQAYWKSGELPEPVRAFSDTGESLLATLGAPTHGGVGVGFEHAPDPAPAPAPVSP